MTDLKVGVSAELDTSGIDRKLQELSNKTTGAMPPKDVVDRSSARRSQEAKRNTDAETRSLRDLQRAWSDLGRTISEVQAKAQQTAFRNLQRSRSALSPYATGVGFGDVVGSSQAWRNRFPSVREANAMRSRLLDTVGASAGTSVPPPPSYNNAVLGRLLGNGALVGANALAGIATGYGTGGAMGAAGGAVGSLLGPVGAGLGYLIGSKVDEATEAAVRNSIGNSELRAVLGAATNGFDELREKTHAATTGLGLLSTEFQPLAKQFAKLSGDVDVLKDVRQSTQFAQSYGMDASGTGAFFANARQYRLTLSADDSRRLSSNLAEAIAKGGGSAKAEEMMGAMSTFMQAQVQRTLSVSPDSANAYLSALSTMAGRDKIPVGVAGGMLNQAAAALSSGGNINVDAALLQQLQMINPGLDKLTLQYLRTNPMGSMSQSIGPGSALYNASSPAERARLTGLSKSLGNRSMIELAAQAVEAQSMGDTRLIGMGMQNVLGLSSATQGLAMYRIAKGGTQAINQWQSVLDTAPERNKSMITEIMGGDGSAKDLKSLRARALEFAGGKGLATALPGDKAQQLAALARDASPEGGERLRTAMVNVLKNVETQDEGRSLVDNTAAIKESTAKLAEKLIPAMEYVKEATRAMLPDDKRRMLDDPKLFALNDAKEKLDKWKNLPEGIPGALIPDSVKSEYQKELSRREQAFKAAQSSYEAQIMGGSASKALPPPGGSSWGLTDPLGAALPAGAGKGVRNLALSPSQYDALFEKYGQAYGVPPMLGKMTASYESGLNPGAINNRNRNGSVDYGLMQINSGNFGHLGLNASNWKDPEQNIRAGMQLLGENYRRAGGSIHDTIRRYVGSGPWAEKVARERTPMYESLVGAPVPADLSRARASKAVADLPVKVIDEAGGWSLGPMTSMKYRDGNLPADEARASGKVGFEPIKAEHTVVLKWPSGEPAAAPLTSTTMHAPRPH